MDKHPFKEMKRPRTMCCSMKLFIVCQGFLQFAQLMYSAYFKSTVTTIERRFGLSSYSSASLTSLHEVSNTLLIVFMSYFGNRVHRPRVIGIGGLLMSLSALLLTVPHFISQPYKFDSVLHDRHDICNLQGNSSNSESCGQDETTRLADTNNVWLLMAFAQLLFGVGSVPVQPFGISYIDDFSTSANAPLYLALMFALSVFGPAVGYLLGAVVLRIYVDVNRTGFGVEQELSLSDPRWVGAWWIGLLIISSCLILSSIPYFYFPRRMPPEENVIGIANDTNEDSPDDVGLREFLKRFPKKIVSFLLNPLFLSLVLAQCCFSSVVAGLSTFLNKYLERQYGASLTFSSLLVGSVNLPAVAMGMLTGGVIMKVGCLPQKKVAHFCIITLTISTMASLPLFFMGCSTKKVSEVNHNLNGSLSMCYSSCSCSDSVFNPVCGSDGVEYISPCHAGCTDFIRDPNNTHKVQLYMDCSCVSGSQRHAAPTTCPNGCPHFLYYVIFLISVAALISNFTYIPMYITVLRLVLPEEKSFALGIQFLLMRMIAWLPAPALFGMVIDRSCIWWRHLCGKKYSCGYYDNSLFRNQYLGLQIGYKVLGISLLILFLWKSKQRQEYNLERAEEERYNLERAEEERHNLARPEEERHNLARPEEERHNLGRTEEERHNLGRTEEERPSLEMTEEEGHHLERTEVKYSLERINGEVL